MGKFHAKSARLLLGGVGLFAVFTSVVSCSSDTKAAPATTTTRPLAVVSTTTTVPVPASVVSVETAATTVPVDGAALLSKALAAIAPGYHFTTTATVDGVVAATADGDRINDASRLVITGNGGSVTYIILPATLVSGAAAWVKPDGGEWQALDAPPSTTTDPIAALKAPTSVVVSSATARATQLVVTVPASALGLSGDAPTAMQVTLSGIALQSVTLSTTTAGKAAMVQATIGPVKDATPILAPI